MPAAASAESCAGRNRLFTSKRKYAWERLCDGNFRPAPSTQGYILDPVVGAAELMNGGGVANRASRCLATTRSS